MERALLGICPLCFLLFPSFRFVRFFLQAGREMRERAVYCRRRTSVLGDSEHSRTGKMSLVAVQKIGGNNGHFIFLGCSGRSDLAVALLSKSLNCVGDEDARTSASQLFSQRAASPTVHLLLGFIALCDARCSHARFTPAETLTVSSAAAACLVSLGLCPKHLNSCSTCTEQQMVRTNTNKDHENVIKCDTCGRMAWVTRNTAWKQTKPQPTKTSPRCEQMGYTNNADNVQRLFSSASLSKCGRIHCSSLNNQRGVSILHFFLDAWEPKQVEAGRLPYPTCTMHG